MSNKFRAVAALALIAFVAACAPQPEPVYVAEPIAAPAPIGSKWK